MGSAMWSTHRAPIKHLFFWPNRTMSLNRFLPDATRLAQRLRQYSGASRSADREDPTSAALPELGTGLDNCPSSSTRVSCARFFPLSSWNVVFAARSGTATGQCPLNVLGQPLSRMFAALVSTPLAPLRMVRINPRVQFPHVHVTP